MVHHFNGEGCAKVIFFSLGKNDVIYYWEFIFVLKNKSN